MCTKQYYWLMLLLLLWSYCTNFFLEITKQYINCAFYMSFVYALTTSWQLDEWPIIKLLAFHFYLKRLNHTNSKHHRNLWCVQIYYVHLQTESSTQSPVFISCILHIWSLIVAIMKIYFLFHRIFFVTLVFHLKYQEQTDAVIN